MTGGTHAERIIALLARWPGLDDDEIARRLRIEPRQTVNQVCRRLADSGVLFREHGASGKIVNTLRKDVPAVSATSAAPRRHPRAAPQFKTFQSPAPGQTLVPADFARTLIIIPCSGRKRDFDAKGGAADSICRHLPPALAHELDEARARLRTRIGLDGSRLVPAWQRYDGALYRSGRAALERLSAAGAQILILSGGYGVVLAAEPIGDYEAALNPAWWPDAILERVLAAYGRAAGVTAVRAFAAASTGYGKVLRSTDWRDHNMDALLISPERAPGAMVKAPASLGEALTALSEGKLTAGWTSSYGLGLEIRAL